MPLTRRAVRDLKFFLVTFFFCCVATSALAEELTPIHHFHIGQKTSHQNGVWVSRPQPLHQEIVDIVINNNIKSLEDYARWLKNTVHYQYDGKTDNWATPQKTLAKKTGDCEDYAFLNAEVIQVLGYQPHFLALVRNGKRAHAICTFQHNGQFLWFDNAQLRKTTVTSLEQFAKNISTQYGYSALLEFDLKAKKWDVLYSKVGTYTHRPLVLPQIILSSP